MDLYLNKNRREEKTTDEIEYLKSAKELTFHPKLSNSKPQLDHIYGEKNVSPSNLQRNNNTYNQINSKKLNTHKPRTKSNEIPQPPKPTASYDPYVKKPNQEDADSYGQQSDFQQAIPEEEQKTLEDYLQHSSNQELLEEEDRDQTPTYHQKFQGNSIPKLESLHPKLGLNPIPTKRTPMNSYLPVVEEPICVLKIELDGENIEEIKVFENDDPAEIVRKFGDNFNLSQNARMRLLEQIEEQI